MSLGCLPEGAWSLRADTARLMQSSSPILESAKPLPTPWDHLGTLHVGGEERRKHYPSLYRAEGNIIDFSQFSTASSCTVASKLG